MRRNRVCIAALSLAVLLVAGAGPRAAAALIRCDDAIDPLLCGSVTVPLDRSGRLPGMIALRIRGIQVGHGSRVVLALVGELRQPRPLDAKLQISDLRLDPLVGRGRLVVFDRRGTSGSGRLTCPALAHGSERPGAVARCAEELGPKRASYTTTESVADVEAVRAAVGTQRMTIYGLGDGARLALAYAAAYPQRVERLVLDSPVPPEGADPFRRSTLGALGRVMRATCLRTCPFTHDPFAELSALLGRARNAPLRVRSRDARGRVQTFRLEPAELVRLVLAGETNGYVQAFLPSAVHATLHGDTALLARLVEMERSESAPADDVAALVTACEDGPVPWAPGTPVAARGAAIDAVLAALPPGAFAPFGPSVARSVGSVDRCREWPESPIAQPQLPLPAVPTLIVSGELALATPLEDAAALARRIPGAYLLRVPIYGYGVEPSSDVFSVGGVSSCAPKALTAFARGERPKPCPRKDDFGPVPGPLRGVASPQLPPRSLRDIPRAGRSLPARAARTLTAVRWTLIDMMGQVDARAELAAGANGVRRYDALRFGGLHGGFARYGARGLVLHRYVYVPGVTVTVGVAGRRPFLQIGGRAAVHGRLTSIVSCEESVCFAGRLAGRIVQVVIPGSA